MFEGKLTKSDRKGKVSYHRNILNSIVELAVSESEGVAINRDEDSKKSKLCRVDFIGNDAYVEVFMKIQQGYNVSDVACKVQENIKRSVDTMTAFTAKEVNIHVIDVVFN